LSIRDDATGVIETFRNVSVAANAVRRIDKVLANESNLVRGSGPLPNARPAKHIEPTAAAPLWGDDNAGNANGTNTKVTGNDVASNGSGLPDNDLNCPGHEDNTQRIIALRQADLFNLLCIPPYDPTNNTAGAVISTAIDYC